MEKLGTIIGIAAALACFIIFVYWKIRFDLWQDDTARDFFSAFGSGKAINVQHDQDMTPNIDAVDNST
jgi:hypothetical protein